MEMLHDQQGHQAIQHAYDSFGMRVVFLEHSVTKYDQID